MNKSSLPQGVGRVIPPVPQVKVVQSVQPKLTPATNLRLSLSQLTTLRWSLSDEVNHLRLARYDGIGLWRPKVADLGVQQSAKLIRNAGLQVSSLSFAGGFTGMNGFSYADAALNNGLIGHIGGFDIYVVLDSTFVDAATTSVSGSKTWTNLGHRVAGVKRTATWSNTSAKWEEKGVSQKTGMEVAGYAYGGLRVWNQAATLTIDITVTA